MFQKARLKLTFWYLAIIMLISISFSAITYRVLTHEVDRFERMQRFFIEKRLGEGNGKRHSFVNPELMKETKQRIFLVLFTINCGIFFISGMLGYFLAGRTLDPISDMIEKQNQFITDASHKLKTPLTSLKSSFEVYLRGKRRTKKEGDVLIAESIDEVNKLEKLSGDLLSAHFQV